MKGVCHESVYRFHYGGVLISREAVSWQSVVVDSSTSVAVPTHILSRCAHSHPNHSAPIQSQIVAMVDRAV